ncbi:hypothetical protein [Arthrobacter sp. SAFR-014]|uniref:hypothetical protein n=1 Tax=unclassified Arthrobacter TaxID=235627 RepID=UPI003F7C1035
MSVEAVVAEEPVLYRRLEVAVRIHPGRVLDLVLGVGNHNVAAFKAGALQPDNGFGGSEQAGLDRHPGRLAIGVVGLDVAY